MYRKIHCTALTYIAGSREQNSYKLRYSASMDTTDTDMFFKDLKEEALHCEQEMEFEKKGKSIVLWVMMLEIQLLHVQICVSIFETTFF